MSFDMVLAFVAGMIVLVSIAYRVRTFGRPEFWKAVHLNVAVFVSFAIGCALFVISGFSPPLRSFSFDAVTSTLMVYAGAVAYRFAVNRVFIPFDTRALVAAIAWFVVVSVAMESRDETFLKIVVWGTVLAECVVVGALSAVLGPVVAATGVAIFMIELSHYDSLDLSRVKLPWSSLAELLSEGLPGGLKYVAIAIVAVTSLSDTLRFYGLQQLASKISSWVKDHLAGGGSHFQ